jgi:MFS family permease
MAGNYYCYDNPAALLSMLQSHFSHDGTAEGEQFQLYYSMMYSVYSLPNIVLPLIGGVLVDRVGVIFALNM